MNPTVVEWVWLVGGFAILAAGLWAFIRWFIAPAIEQLQILRATMQEEDSAAQDAQSHGSNPRDNHVSLTRT